MFSKKATKIDEIFTVNLTVTTYCQIDGEDFVNFCGLLVKLNYCENVLVITVLVFLIHLFVRAILFMKKLKIKETKAT
jgi:hypothetical protein